MKVSVGLPATIPNVRGDLVTEWARRAEVLGFSSLGIIDRLVYTNYEPLVTLAAAAAVTKKIGLMTTILVAPLRNAVLLAKQAATLDRISGGRLTLGLGVGGRQEEFDAAGQQVKGRGARFEEQLSAMKKIWSGEKLAPNIGRIGPAPAQEGGPRILIGGYSPAAISRVGRWGDGFISGRGDPKVAASAFKLAKASWKANGRQGKPRFVCATYFALGDRAREDGVSYLRDYYSFAGTLAEDMANHLLTKPNEVKVAIDAFSSIGADELLMWPCVAKISQLDLLSELLPRSP
jgi:alkanesulfonate monooxygenase SsuD/methylene tetrahydromethanopterin reductase-like flavin-dependent oxidoreductase (luciferase family)